MLAHGPRRDPVVAVTFDACPTSRSPGFAPEIVDLLERERVPTTFFVSGRWAETHPKEFARLRSVPFFEIALHGHRHRHLVHGAPEAMLAEIEDGRAALRRLGAEPVAIFRPPFGDSPEELASVARRAGVVAVTWDVAPGDPDPLVSAATIERGVTGRSEPGSVVV
ncbi:MAG: polysaccharide deacetylase family protein, partial [Alphaproteobacteria bacterium]